ncbi:MAG: DUF2203 domain-containing protein [Thermus sp.]
MFPRIYTKEEADQLLPELRRVLAQMREAKRGLEEALRRLPKARGLERKALEEEARFLKGSLEADLQYLSRLGVFLKDLEKGLVDFPARLEGQVVFLCWQEGEPEVLHWHPLAEGFRARRPLQEALLTPPPPETPLAARGPRG